MKKLVLAAALIALGTAPALACTAADVQAKAQAFVAKYQELAQKDPQRAQAMAPKIQEGAQKLQAAMQKNPNDLAEVCKYYDDLIAEASK